MHVAERPKESKVVDVAGLIDKGVVFDLRTSEAPEERASRLRREEAEADHKLRQETEEAQASDRADPAHLRDDYRGCRFPGQCLYCGGWGPEDRPAGQGDGHHHGHRRGWGGLHDGQGKQVGARADSAEVSQLNGRWRALQEIIISRRPGRHKTGTLGGHIQSRQVQRTKENPAKSPLSHIIHGSNSATITSCNSVVTSQFDGDSNRCNPLALGAGERRFESGHPDCMSSRSARAGLTLLRQPIDRPRIAEPGIPPEPTPPTLAFIVLDRLSIRSSITRTCSRGG